MLFFKEETNDDAADFKMDDTVSQDESSGKDDLTPDDGDKDETNPKPAPDADDTSDDMSDDLGSDEPEGDGTPLKEFQENKKNVLYTQYENLSSVAEDLDTAISRAILNVDSELKELYSNISKTIKEERSKMSHIMMKSFTSTDYTQLMYYFLIFKSTFTTISKLVNSTLKKEDKNG